MSKVFSNGLYLKLISNLFKNVPIHNLKFKASLSSCSSQSDKSKKKTFNTPHPPKDPPENYNPPCLEHEAFAIPSFIPAAIFRPFSSKDEKLGPGADKRCGYKNTEYYSYHRYSFVALQVLCLQLREQRKKGANIRCLYDYEESDEEKYSSDEDNK